MVTNEQVYEVLRKCYDPEIPVSLVDLGLIYDVKVEDDQRQGGDDPDGHGAAPLTASSASR
jgi:metal-sulfur cluster biosynthetic enzyme